MKKMHAVLVLGLILLNSVFLMAGGSSDKDKTGDARHPFTSKTLIQVLNKQKKISFISEALKNTGLADKMAHLEGYTLFVPTDDAINRLHDTVRKAMMNDPQALLAVLTDQMVKGVFSVKELEKMNVIMTMGEVRMDIGKRGSKTTLANSDLIKTDLFGKGFVVHIVTGVIVSGLTIKK